MHVVVAWQPRCSASPHAHAGQSCFPQHLLLGQTEGGAVGRGHPGVSAGLAPLQMSHTASPSPPGLGPGLQAPRGRVLVNGGICWSSLCPQHPMSSPSKRKRKQGPNRQEPLPSQASERPRKPLGRPQTRRWTPNSWAGSRSQTAWPRLRPHCFFEKWKTDFRLASDSPPRCEV